MAAGGVDQIADTVCEVMLRDSTREDDTCLLVCQLTSDRAAGGREPPAPARPAACHEAVPAACHEAVPAFRG